MKQVRLYSCMACGGTVSKPPCVAPPKPERNHKGQMVEHKISYVGLHGWECRNCGRGVKVKCILKEYDVNG